MNITFDESDNLQNIKDVIVSVIVINKLDISKIIKEIGLKISNAIKNNKIVSDEIQFIVAFAVEKIQNITGSSITTKIIIDTIDQYQVHPNSQHHEVVGSCVDEMHPP